MSLFLAVDGLREWRGMSDTCGELLERLLAAKSTKEIGDVPDEDLVQLLEEMSRTDSEVPNIQKIKSAVQKLNPRPSEASFI